MHKNMQVVWLAVFPRCYIKQSNIDKDIVTEQQYQCSLSEHTHVFAELVKSQILFSTLIAIYNILPVTTDFQTAIALQQPNKYT